MLEEDEEMQEGPQFVHGKEEGAKPARSLSKLAALRQQRQARKGHKVTGMDSYKSKKGKGDATKNSKLQPYAYMRLDPKLGKEKTRGKAVASIERVVQKAKKGIAK